MSSFDDYEDDRELFLEMGEKDSNICPKQAPSRLKSSRFPIIVLLSIVAHILLLLSWTRLSHVPEVPLGSPKSTGLYSKSSDSIAQGLFIWNANDLDPFDGVITSQIEVWEGDAWDNSVYTGPPRKALDNAWNKLQLGKSSNSEETEDQV